MNFFSTYKDKGEKYTLSLLIYHYYEFKFKNQGFDFKNGNGYIIDNYTRGMIKYLAFDRNGFLEKGAYNHS